MSFTYMDGVLMNLDRIRIVGFLHPRLAMVGIESELETIFLEALPPQLIDERLSEYDRRKPKDPRDYEERKSTIIRYELSNSPNLTSQPKQSDQFLRDLKKRAGQARHSRAAVSVYRVGRAVDQAKAFVNLLKESTMEKALNCENEKLRVDFHLGKVLMTESGQITLPCPSCGSVLARYSMGVPLRESMYFREPAERRLAMSELAGELFVVFSIEAEKIFDATESEVITKAAQALLAVHKTIRPG